MNLDKTEIDYSSIVPATPNLIEDSWEAPKHVYFGKKLPNGKMEKEPVYVHQSLPAMMYGWFENRVRAAIANTRAELDDLIAAGYKDTPAAFGIITAPDAEEVARRKIAKEADPELATETVEIVKRKPGRPKAS